MDPPTEREFVAATPLAEVPSGVDSSELQARELDWLERSILISNVRLACIQISEKWGLLLPEARAWLNEAFRSATEEQRQLRESLVLTVTQDDAKGTRTVTVSGLKALAGDHADLPHATSVRACFTDARELIDE